MFYGAIMRRLVTAILSVFFLLLTACSQQHTVPYSQVIALELKDFSKKGDGEGLAEQLPEHNILLNHPLDMAMAFSMDSGVGVAIAVGMHKQNTKKTVEALKGLPVFPWEERLTSLLKEAEQKKDWQEILTKVRAKKRKVVLSSYGYLFGYPKATLRSRLVVRMETGTGEKVWEKMLKIVSEQYPITGESSWSDEAVFNLEIEKALPQLVELLKKELGEDES